MSTKPNSQLTKLKERYHQWAGFTLVGDSLDEVLDEIARMEYTLQNEISDQGSKLATLAKECFVQQGKE